MLRVTQLSGFGAGGEGLVLPLATIVASKVETGSGSIHTFSGVSFGPASTNRRLVACTCLFSSEATAMDIQSVSIGGVSAAGIDRGEFLAGGPSAGAGLFHAAVPTGAIGDVVVDWTNSVSSFSAGLILVALSDKATAEHDNGNNGGGGSGGTQISTSLDIPADGTLVAVSAHSNTNDTTLTGVTERTEIPVGNAAMAVGFDTEMGAETGRTVTASWSGTATRAIIATSFSVS